MANSTFERYRPLLLLVGSLLACSAVLGIVVFRPKIKAVETLRNEAAAKTQQFTEAFHSWEQMFEKRDENTRAWDEDLARFNQRIPVQPNQDEFMAELTSLIVRRHLQELHLSVEEDKKRPSVGAVAEGPNLSSTSDSSPAETGPAAGAPAMAEIHYQLIFTSTYRDLAEFLDDLPRMRRLVALRTLTIREKEGKMGAALDLSIYHRVQP